MRVALVAPNVEWHLKPNDQDALVELSSAISERVLPHECVDGALREKGSEFPALKKNQKILTPSHR
jgi:hypothetical protein